MTGDVGNFHNLEAVYALAVERGDYRRGMWIALRGARSRPSRAEKKIWRFRAIECFRRRHDPLPGKLGHAEG